MKTVLLAFALATLASAAQAQDGFDRIWSRWGTDLQSQGISQPMARQAIHWSELQYELGQCRTHLSADDVSYWRTWWQDTPLATSDMGQAIIEGGNELYTEGLEAAVAAPLAREHCQRVFDTWLAEMRAIMAAD